jgi:predicted membrane protein
MIITILISTIIWFLFIPYRAHGDYWLIRAGIVISHAENAIVSITMASLLSYVAIASLWLVPAYLSIYWIGFDMLLNKFRGKELLYLGTTAFLDRSFHNKYIQLSVKIACLLICVLGCLLIKK